MFILVTMREENTTQATLLMIPIIQMVVKAREGEESRLAMKLSGGLVTTAKEMDAKMAETKPAAAYGNNIV